MKLSSVHIVGQGMIPIPGTHRRETELHAAQGWELVRLEDGRIHGRRVEQVEGGHTVTREVWLEHASVSYAALHEPATAVVVDMKPSPVDIAEAVKRGGRRVR